MSYLKRVCQVIPKNGGGAKALAKKKFDVYPSAYANAWAAKKYKSWGGKWKTKEQIEYEKLVVLYEDLRKWFDQKWVNIGKKNKDGSHPECGTSGKNRGYAKCVPKAKAQKMTSKEKESATRRKRQAQNKANRGGKTSNNAKGQKPIRVNTKTEK